MSAVPILIQYEQDYADEFSIYGLRVTTLGKWTATVEKIRQAFESGELSEDNEFYFGTNEAVQFQNFSDFESCYTITSITPERVDFLRSVFDLYKNYESDTFDWGHFIIPEVQ